MRWKGIRLRRQVQREKIKRMCSVIERGSKNIEKKEVGSDIDSNQCESEREAQVPRETERGPSPSACFRAFRQLSQATAAGGRHIAGLNFEPSGTLPVGSWIRENHASRRPFGYRRQTFPVAQPAYGKST